MNFQNKLMEFIDKNTLAKSSHSGDDVRLWERGSRRIVTKTSTLQKQRLIASAILQENFLPFCQDIRVVPILLRQINRKRAKVTMPFIEGYTGAQLYVNVAPHDLNNISLSLANNITRSLRAGHFVPLQIFQKLSEEKIESVAESLAKKTKRHFSLDDKLIKEINANVRDRLRYLQLDCPLGQTHGDLTFSNIIYNKNTTTIWLIDFLTSFMQTPLIDVAKLIQEFKYQWSARYMPPNQFLSARIVGERLLSTLFQNIDTKLLPMIGALSVINLYRIAPYVKDSVTHEWLLKALNEELECEY